MSKTRRVEQIEALTESVAMVLGWVGWAVILGGILYAVLK